MRMFLGAKRIVFAGRRALAMLRIAEAMSLVQVSPISTALEFRLKSPVMSLYYCWLVPEPVFCFPTFTFRSIAVGEIRKICGQMRRRSVK